MTHSDRVKLVLAAFNAHQERKTDEYIRKGQKAAQEAIQAAIREGRIRNSRELQAEAQKGRERARIEHDKAAGRGYCLEAWTQQGAESTYTVICYLA